MDFIFSYIYKFLGRFLGVSRPLPQNAKTLIWMIALYDFSFVISAIFLNVFLFRNNGWHVVMVFNLVQFVLVMPAFWMGGVLSPKFGHRFSYQLGFICYAALFLSVLLLRGSASDYSVFLGILSGLAIGFYYLGQHALTLDLTRTKDRDYFFALYLFISSLFKILAPGLSGWIIASLNAQNGAGKPGLLGYYVVFAIILLIYLVLIVQSFRLKVPRRTVKFDFLKVLRYGGNEQLNRMLWAWFFAGLRGGLFWFVTGIFVYRAFKNELAVGNYNMMMTFLAVVTAYALSRWAERKHRPKGLAISSVFIMAAFLVLSINMGPLALLIFGVLYSMGMTWFQVGFSAISFEAIENSRDAAKRKMEYLTVREIPLEIGRLIGMGAFWSALFYFGEAGVRVVVFLMGLTQLGVYAYSLPKGGWKKAFRK